MPRKNLGKGTSKSRNSKISGKSIQLDYTHKFSPPSALNTAISRPRLLAELRDNQRHSAVVVQGPGGYGKSTLMQQLYDQFTNNGIITGWLTLDESDNDISRFNTLLSVLFYHIDESLERRNFDESSQFTGSSAVDNLLQSLAVTIEPIALFLDEFQSIKDPINIALFTTLIERCPPNITFYLGTRVIPDFARGNFLINGRVKLIDAEQLCFSSEEVTEFLNLVGFEVSSLESEAFRDQTGGWPAILQLLQLALKGGKVDRNTLLVWIKGCESELADYLAYNAMRGQPPERIEFLLKTSLLPRLSAPLCEAVTGKEGAQQILQELVSKGLFIRVIDSQKKWFKYHSLFSDYLQSQFKKEFTIKTQDIHLIAANWFHKEDLFDEAIHQAIKAERYDLAADILAEWSPRLICNARMQTVDKLCSLMPDEFIKERPMLCWSLTLARMFFSQRLSAKEPLAWLTQQVFEGEQYAELRKSVRIWECTNAYVHDQVKDFSSLLPQLVIETGDMPQYHCFEMSALGNLTAIYHLRKRHFIIAKEHAILALSLSERCHAAFSGAYAVALLSIALMQTGELNLAVKKLKDGLNDNDLRIQGSFSTAPLSATYGLALYEGGNFVEAESLLRDTIDTISKTMPTDWLVAAYISLARATEFSDKENNDSLEILDHAEKLGYVRQDQRLIQAVRREHIHRSLVKGNLKEATLLAERAALNDARDEDPPCYHITEGCDDDTISRIRLNIYQGDHQRALQELEFEIAEASNCEWLRRRIKLLILESMAYKVSGDPFKARERMLAALELAAPQTYAAAFVEEGPACISVVEDVKGQISSGKKNRLREIMSIILECAGGNNTEEGNVPTTSPLIEQPTKRELEILNLVVEGASNPEIADRLFVSTNTVKYHMKNLYGKFGVKSRVKLIATARQLGLL